MDLASVYYLGTTIGMFAIFAMIVVKTCSRKQRDKGETPKYRMMEED